MAAAAKRATQRVGQMLVARPEQRLTWTVTTSGARVQQVTCTPIPRRLREVQGRSSLLAALYSSMVSSVGILLDNSLLKPKRIVHSILDSRDFCLQAS